MKRLIFVILLLAVKAVAGEPGAPVKVGLHYSVPWAYADAEGRLQGIDYGIVRHVFDQLGVEVDIELFAYERLIQKFRDKELDYVSPMAFAVTGAHQTQDYLDIQDVAVTRAKAAIVLEQMTDLQGKAVVAYQKASEVLGADFKSALKDTAYMEMADRERQLDLLINNKVDVVVGDRRVLEYFSRKNFGEGKIAVHDIFPQTSYPGAFWDTDLADSFNRILKQMREAGQLQEYYSSPRH